MESLRASGLAGRAACVIPYALNLPSPVMGLLSQGGGNSERVTSYLRRSRDVLRDDSGARHNYGRREGLTIVRATIMGVSVLIVATTKAMAVPTRVYAADLLLDVGQIALPRRHMCCRPHQ